MDHPNLDDKQAALVKHIDHLTAEVDHLTAELATARTAWDEWKASSRAGHAHASDMAAENARLRAGIEEQVRRWETARDLWEGSRYAGAEWSICNTGALEAARLLNPPTAPERPTEDDPDEALTKVIASAFYAYLDFRRRFVDPAPDTEPEQPESIAGATDSTSTEDGYL